MKSVRRFGGGSQPSAVWRLEQGIYDQENVLNVSDHVFYGI
jgi:hypothetical protein